jgi:6-phosphogluconolactonase (cycloisomerase 2 family)
MKRLAYAVAMLFTLALAGPDAEARLEAPDHILYGNVTLHGQPVAAGTVIEMRRAGQGEVLVRYIMGRDLRLGEQYALRTPMDVVDPRLPGRARPGDPVEIYIGSRLAAETSIGLEGRAERLDLDPQNLGAGPSISINDVQVLEGNTGTTPATFTVDMNTTVGYATVIDWHTVDITAIGGASCEFGIDYLQAAETLEIPAGQMQGQLTVQVCANEIAQPDREFRVVLVPQTEAQLAKGVGIGTIIDDDDVPRLQVADATVLKPAVGHTTSMTFTPGLSRSHEFDVTVDYQTNDIDAIAGLDYAATQGSFTIPAGELSSQVSVTIFGTPDIEPTKRFELTFANPVNVDIDGVSALGNIVDPRFDPSLIHEDDVVNGEDGIAGLTEPTAMALSPDGRQAYVVSESGHSVLVFDRQRSTGHLSWVDTYNASSPGFENATLSGPMAIRASADGKNVYVASRLSKAIVVFARDVDTGALSFVENQVQDQPTYSGSDVMVRGLNGVKALHVSVDGSHVYALGAEDHALSLFGRDTVTGELTFIEAYFNGTEDHAGNVISHMNRPSGLAGSNDGSHLYVASRFGNAVQVFGRNNDPDSADYGRLSYQTAYRNGLAGISGLAGAFDLVIGNDDQQVYVIAEQDNAVVWFDRESDGSLVLREQWRKGDANLPGLGGPQGIALAPAGDELFVTGFGDHSLTVFRRHSGGDTYQAGEISPRQTIFDNEGDVMNMAGPLAVVASSNHRHVYVVANEDNAIVLFRRDLGDVIFQDRLEAAP